MIVDTRPEEDLRVLTGKLRELLALRQTADPEAAERMRGAFVVVSLAATDYLDAARRFGVTVDAELLALVDQVRAVLA